MSQFSEVFKGDTFRCIQTLIGENSKGKECELFRDGKVYESNNDGCITDECGNRHHEITPSFGVKYFQLIVIENRKHKKL